MNELLGYAFGCVIFFIAIFLARILYVIGKIGFYLIKETFFYKDDE